MKTLFTTDQSVCKGLEWHEHNGKRYLYLDLKDLNSFEILKSSKHLKKVMKEQAENSVLFLLDVTDADISMNDNLTLAKMSKNVQDKILRSAFIGVDGYIKKLFSIYRNITSTKAVLLNNREEALDYLTNTRD